MIRPSRWRRLGPLLVLAASCIASHKLDAAATPAANPPAIAPTHETAAEEAPDILVFVDGDRVRGKSIGREGDFLIFQSVRFGELRVPASTAQVVPARAATTVESTPAPQTTGESPTPPQLAAGAPGSAEVTGPTPAEAAAGAQPVEPPARPHWTSPMALAIALRDFLGPWEGRFATTASLLTNTTKRLDVGLSLTVKRKWERDEANIEVRYDLADTATAEGTDLLRANGLWRHELPGPWFFNYRPKLEWNRNYLVNRVAADYVLLQNEVGLGVNLLDRKHQKVRVGIAENVFDVWTVHDGRHTTRDNQSMFAELELGLPWRMSLTDRGVWYYTINSGDTGWENRFELNKKFSDALSLGLRQELRRNNPDVRVSDYTLWRLQLGLDF